MGAVYRARHAFLRRPTAIKLIRSDRVGQEALARFEREVQLTGQLTHPNTIAIYDYGRTPEGIFYYAMEYLPGLPLDQVISADGAQPESRVVHLVKQICSSLAEAHRMGLVHRDVKPANTMLCERGGNYDVVKVLDFGLVKELRSESEAGVTGMGLVVGTPLYMAPESAAGAEHTGPASDVYAVGAIAYALLTGHQVFTGNSGVEIISHHLHIGAGSTLRAARPRGRSLPRASDPLLPRQTCVGPARRRGGVAPGARGRLDRTRLDAAGGPRVVGDEGPSPADAATRRRGERLARPQARGERVEPGGQLESFRAVARRFHADPRPVGSGQAAQRPLAAPRYFTL